MRVDVACGGGARVCVCGGGGLTGKGREQLLLNGAMYLILYCIHLAYHVVETFGDIPLGLRVDEPRDHHPPLLHQRTPHLVRINPTTRKRNHVNNRSNGGGGDWSCLSRPPHPPSHTPAPSHPISNSLVLNRGVQFCIVSEIPDQWDKAGSRGAGWIEV